MKAVFDPEKPGRFVILQDVPQTERLGEIWLAVANAIRLRDELTAAIEAAGVARVELKAEDTYGLPGGELALTGSGVRKLAEAVEAEYHGKKPEDFDEVMEHAERVSPSPRELDVATITGEYELGGRLTIEYAAPIEEWNDPGRWLVEDLLVKMMADAEHRAGVPFFKRSGISWTRRKVETQE